MTIVQRTRFERWMKNLTGFRGPLAMDLDHGVSPVYDLGRTDGIELDDEQAFWYNQNSQAAVAAQFQAIQVQCSSGRAVIDQIWVRTVAIAQIRIGRVANLAAPTSTSSPSVRNIFLGQIFANLGSVAVATFSQAADPLAGQQVISTDIGVVGGPAQIIPAQFVIAPGAALTISPSVVNLAISIGFLGRWLADQT